MALPVQTLKMEIINEDFVMEANLAELEELTKRAQDAVADAKKKADEAAHDIVDEEGTQEGIPGLTI